MGQILMTDMAFLHSKMVQQLNNLLLHFDLKEEKDLNEISHMVRSATKVKGNIFFVWV